MNDVFQQMRDLDEFIQISLLSEYYYCKRRCGLLLLEGRDNQNSYMIDGSIQHAKVHTSKIEKRTGVTKIFNHQIFSNKYSLIGKMDCLECFDSNIGAYVDILGGKYILYPVEHKHGELRNEEEYKIQLCAQAMCLEEMYNTKIEKGALYFINSNKRLEVDFTEELRRKVIFGIIEIFEIIDKTTMPTPIYKRKCGKCSLVEKCNPKTNSINVYLSEMWGELP